MPKRDPELLLQDMLNAARKISRYTQSLSQQQFLASDITVDAVVRNLEIIGEAARQLPEAYTGQHPHIPWRQLAGLRNRIVHDYSGLDEEMIWHIIHADLPHLATQLSHLTDAKNPESADD